MSSRFRDCCGSEAVSYGFDVGPEIVAGICGPTRLCVSKPAPSCDLLRVGQKYIGKVAHRGFKIYVDALFGDPNVEIGFSRLFHVAVCKNRSETK